MISTRKPPILSTRSAASAASPRVRSAGDESVATASRRDDTWQSAARAPAAASGSVGGSPARPASDLPPQAFNTCQVGLVLRTVLLAEAGVAVAALFLSATLEQWATLAATLTGGVFPAVLFWLVGVCALKRPLARWSASSRMLAGCAIGVLAGLYGCVMLGFAGWPGAMAWLASACAGGLFAALMTTFLVLRARSQAPVALAARVQELQSRIRPHFLFNTLNSAIALVREDPERAERVLEDLAELFRTALAEADESITLADEIELARRYLAIEQVRFGDRLRVTWSIDEAAGDARLPPLLLQPLVENAVKHGVEPSLEGADVRVRTERRGGGVLIEVTNTLPPLRWADEPLPRGHGIAQANIRDRLRLLHDIESQFRSGVENGRYRVRIDIPAARR